MRRLSISAALLLALVVTACSRAESKEPANSTAKGKNMGPNLSASGYDITPLPPGDVAKLAAKLTPEEYRITQKAGTEPAFCGNLLDNHKDGVYVCIVCGLPLFASAHKFDSGTGWPSFYRPFDPAHVVRKEDRAFGMTRVEIECARCGAHLGHVFDDGPRPTGERYCLNSAALRFLEKGEPVPPESAPVKTEVAYFAGGCFWGIQHYFKKGPGVLDAVSGYMQGSTPNPTYKQVCSDRTGHAETVKVVFDPTRITYRRLLEAFFKMHDPTQVGGQGPDMGSQYRSGIWTANEAQQREAEAFIREQTELKRYPKKIVTLVEPAMTFYPAEEYHQDYIVKNGAFCHVANPW